MSDIVLVRTGFNTHVAMDLYMEFEQAIIERVGCRTVKGPGPSSSKAVHALLKFWPNPKLPFRDTNRYLAVGYQPEKSFPYLNLRAKAKYLWMYDAWESRFAEIERFVRTCGIDILMLSSKQAADHFSSLQLPRFSAHWVPEAVDCSAYRSKPMSERSIDVLQLGRKWEAYHQTIAPGLLKEGRKYVYETRPGKIIFKDRAQFISGLSDSKISICVPSNITHPERSGAISTMTTRYLQSMASRCLVLGELPHDMQYLFEHEPVIKIDKSDPVGQILHILDNVDEFQPLIERNYRAVVNGHTWQHRADKILSLVDGG